MLMQFFYLRYLKKRKTFLITYKKNFKKTHFFKKKGYKIILIKSLSSKDDFNLLFKKLYKMGYSRVLIETGLTFLNTLIKYRLINDLYVFKSNNKLKKKGKNNTTLKYFNNILSKSISINLNGDKLYKKEF